MFPGLGGGKIDPRMMKQAMKRMGIDETELEGVQEVIIRFSDKELVVSSPHVSKVSAMGNVSFQISGNVTERSLDTKPSISADDVQTVMEQTGADEETARDAIESAAGDLAAAIMELNKKEE